MAGSQFQRYAALLRHRGELGLTDGEAAALLKVPVTNVTSLRARLGADISRPPGRAAMRRSPSGCLNKVWVLKPFGVEAQAA